MEISSSIFRGLSAWQTRDFLVCFSVPGEANSSAEKVGGESMGVREGVKE